MDKWIGHFLRMAEHHALLSKDPSTKVGALIVTKDHDTLTTGLNGFPRRVADTKERLENRDTKLKLIVHAEMNALISAAKLGVSVAGCSIYVTQPPCVRCAVHIIQAGIVRVVARPVKADSKWSEDMAEAATILREAGVEYAVHTVEEACSAVDDWDRWLPGRDHTTGTR